MPKLINRFYRLVGPFGTEELGNKRELIRQARSLAAHKGGSYSVFTVDEGQAPQLIFQCHALENRPRVRGGQYKVVSDEL